MSQTNFQLQLDGGIADRHELPAYDGYMALAGFAWTLTIISEFVETGQIRHKGEFSARSNVLAKSISSGSVIADYIVSLSQNPVILTGVSIGSGVALNMASNFLYDLVKRTLDRNLGNPINATTDQLEVLEKTRGGDLEALVAAVEPAVRQSHMVIGNGAHVINIHGGRNVINSYDRETKNYVTQTIQEQQMREKDLSVASFNANSGHGSVYDADLGRTIPIKLNKGTLQGAKAILSWGLHEYASGTGKKISLRYYRLMALDGTPKKYIVFDAKRPTP